MHECQARGSHSLGNITSALTFPCPGCQLQTSPSAGAKLSEQEIQAALGAERCAVTSNTGTVHLRGFISVRGRKRIIYILFFFFLFSFFCLRQKAVLRLRSIKETLRTHKSFCKSTDIQTTTVLMLPG